MAPSNPSTSLAPLRTYLRETAQPVQAAALTLPLLVLYGVGILVVPQARNGADLVSSLLHSLLARLGTSETMGYLGFYAFLALLNAGLVWHLSRTTRFSGRWMWGVLFESALYAVAVGSVSSSVTTKLTHVLAATSAQGAAADTSPIAGVIMSAGAGLHEELVFRLGLVGGLGRLWLGPTWRQGSARLVALLLGTAVLFSLAHHVVEPFALVPFVFRSVAGLLFGGLFLLRGFAVAAWTHALYDVWVIVLLSP